LAELFFRRRAETDLAKLYTYIVKQSASPEIAINYIRSIRKRCDAILAFPQAGHRRDDLRTGVYIIGFERRVVIAYTILPSGDVEIGRIFYGGRDYETLLSSDAKSHGGSPKSR
jgi:toxin ParE1/3/4